MRTAWSGSRLLAIGGLAGGTLGTVGGMIAPSCRTIGPVLIGLGSLVMTVMNLVVLIRSRP